MKKTTKQQKTEARIAAEVIAEQITNPKAPGIAALMQRISSLTAAAKVHDNAAAYAFALAQIDRTARAYWQNGSTEARATMYRITSLTQAAAKRAQAEPADHRPDLFAYALDQIGQATRTFWKQQARS